MPSTHSPGNPSYRCMSHVPPSGGVKVQTGGEQHVAEPANPKEILSKIKQASSNIDWKKAGIRALSLLSGVALGALTGLAITGIMVTPVGWAIASAALLVALITAVHCGGTEELIRALKYAILGFTAGMGAGVVQGTTMVAAAAGKTIAQYGGAKFGQYIVGWAYIFVSSVFFAIHARRDLLR